MVQIILAAVAAYIATNIDDMFINMLFFTQSQNETDDRKIITGKYIGTAALIAASILGAYGVQTLIGRYIWALGFIPLALGIKEAINIFSNINEENEPVNISKGLTMSIALMTIASGGDNIGVYIPLFASFNMIETAITIIVFAIMTGLWCLSGKMMTKLPVVEKALAKYKKFIVPVVYILLGVYIILK